MRRPVRKRVRERNQLSVASGLQKRGRHAHGETGGVGIRYERGGTLPHAETAHTLNKVLAVNKP